MAPIVALGHFRAGGAAHDITEELPQPKMRDFAVIYRISFEQVGHELFEAMAFPMSSHAGQIAKVTSIKTQSAEVNLRQ
jgi:hypothetical protein